MAEELHKLAYSKRTWLSHCSTGRDKRPDWELDLKRRELRVLEQATADYRVAHERKT
jgi:hypothetical protein